MQQTEEISGLKLELNTVFEKFDQLEKQVFLFLQRSIFIYLFNNIIYFYLNYQTKESKNNSRN